MWEQSQVKSILVALARDGIMRTLPSARPSGRP
jgi:hypothetical protein